MNTYEIWIRTKAGYNARITFQASDTGTALAIAQSTYGAENIAHAPSQVFEG